MSVILKNCLLLTTETTGREPQHRDRGLWPEERQAAAAIAPQLSASCSSPWPEKSDVTCCYVPAPDCGCVASQLGNIRATEQQPPPRTETHSNPCPAPHRKAARPRTAARSPSAPGAELQEGLPVVLQNCSGLGQLWVPSTWLLVSKTRLGSDADQ